MNSPIAEPSASLKIVPYYVMKKPSEPSLIGSLISYIARVPTSLSKIQHNNQREMRMNSMLTRNAKKAIKLEEVWDMNVENKTISTMGTTIAAILISPIP